jgi:HTH-type transcriptional regulator, sugar sensing transcriptional regulator
MLQRLFHNLGVDEKEAKIYLAALEVGSSPVSEIAEKARMNRVTAYGILEKLVQKGMMSFMIKRKMKYFHATDPELLLKEYQKRIRDLEKALPDLKRLYGETPHPKVSYYEGVDGIKTIYHDTLMAQTEILNFCNSREIREFWPGYDDEYVAERVKRKIYLRGIAPDDRLGQKVRAADAEMLREIRLIPRARYNFSNDINIYDNKVAIISFRYEPIGMIIENAEIADTQRIIFQTVWDFAETFFS